MKKLFAFILSIALMLSLCTVFASAEETLVSVGKFYVKTGEYTEGSNTYHPDEGGVTLTDGVISSAVGYSDQAWFGMAAISDSSVIFEGTAANTVTVDLGEEIECSKYVFYSEEFTGAGISTPAVVVVEVSKDGAVWYEAGRAERVKTGGDSGAENGLYTYTVEGKANIRYVRFTATHRSSWIFVSEVEVYSGGDAKEIAMESGDASDASQEVSDTESSETSAPQPEQGGSSATVAIIAAAVIALAAIICAVFVLKNKKR